MPRVTVMGSGTLYNLLARFAFLISGYALQISMAHWLESPADYGRFGVLMSVVTLARVWLSTGVPQSVSQFVAADLASAEATYQRGAVIQVSGAALISVAFLALVPVLTRLFGDDELGPLLLSATPLIVLMAFYQVNLGYIGGRLWFGRQALLTLVYSVARYAVPAGLVLTGFGISGSLWGMVIATALVAWGSWLFIPRARQPSPVSVERFLSASWPLVISSFAVSTLLNLDLLLLGKYFPGSDQVGFYSGAVNLGKAPYVVFYAFSTTALPALAHLHAAGDLARVRAALSRQVRFLLLASVPSSALLAVTASESLELVFGRSYAAARTPLALLALSTCALSLLVVLSSAVTASGQPRVSMLIAVGCLPAQLVFGAFLIPGAGMLGAAASNVLATVIGLAAAVVAIYRTIGNVFEGRSLVAIVASSALSSVVLYLLPRAHDIWLIGKLVLGFAIYGLALLVTRGITMAEVVRLQRRALCRS